MNSDNTRAVYQNLPHKPIKRDQNWPNERRIFIYNLSRANIIAPQTTFSNIQKQEMLLLENVPKESVAERPFTDVLSTQMEPTLRKYPYNFSIDMCESLERLIGYKGPQELSHIIRVLSRRFLKNEERIPHDLIPHFLTAQLDDVSLLYILQNHAKRTNRTAPPRITVPARNLREKIAAAPRYHSPLRPIPLAQHAAYPDLINLYCLLCQSNIPSDHFVHSHKGIFVNVEDLQPTLTNGNFLYACSCEHVFCTGFAAAAHILSTQHDGSHCFGHTFPHYNQPFQAALLHISQNHLAENLEVELEFALIKANPTLTALYRKLFTPQILPFLIEAFESHITTIQSILDSNAGAQAHRALLDGPPDLNILTYFKHMNSAHPPNRERDYYAHMAELYSTTSAYMVTGLCDEHTVPNWLVHSPGIIRPTGFGSTDHPIITYGITTLFVSPISSKVKSYNLKSPVTHRMINTNVSIHENDVKVASSTHILYRLISRAPNKIHIVEICCYASTGQLKRSLMARQIAIIFHLSSLVQTNKRMKPMILLALQNPPSTAFEYLSTKEIIDKHRKAERILATCCNAANLLPLPLLGVLQGDLPDRRHHRVAVVPSATVTHVTPEASLLFTRLVELMSPTWFYLKTRSPGIW